jgi:hypothetical protein
VCLFARISIWLFFFDSKNHRSNERKRLESFLALPRKIFVMGRGVSLSLEKRKIKGRGDLEYQSGM